MGKETCKVTFPPELHLEIGVVLLDNHMGKETCKNISRTPELHLEIGVVL